MREKRDRTAGLEPRRSHRARDLARRAPAYLAAAAVALGLKYRFGDAPAEDLRWILAPLARLVGLFGGIGFYWEPPAGFVSNRAGAVIAPSCSGITFLVVCFCALTFPLLHRREKLGGALAWVGVSLVAAYAATLCANTVRVIASVHLYRADIYGSWLDPARAHRLLGIAVYLGFLLPAYLAVERLTRGGAPAPAWPASGIRFLYPPFACYLLFTVAIPLLRAPGRTTAPPFVEHLFFVAAASLALFGLCLGLWALGAARVDLAGSERENVHSAGIKP
jgi:exosortase K